MEGIIGFITPFASNFAPRGWAFCAGQLMAISQNTALFSILGTTYGGNGQTTFALPDLRGRAAMGNGDGPGLSPRDLGEIGGSEIYTMLLSQLPIHTHTATVQISPGANTTADATTPADTVYATPAAGESIYGPAPTTKMQSYNGTLTTGPSAGSSQPFSTLHPVLALSYVICISGVFPSRN